MSGSSTPQRLAGVGEGGWVPPVSRQGQRLAYARRYADANIWRVEVPGVNENASPEVQLTSSTLLDVDAGFSPDGNRIAFVSTRTGSWEIWTCKGDGSDARQLTSLGAYECRTPRWSPDGEQIAFESDHNRRMEIYIISANGGKPKRFTNSSGNNRIPSWSRDGKWIYFASERSGEPQVWKAPVGGGEAVQVTRSGLPRHWNLLMASGFTTRKTMEIAGFGKSLQLGERRPRYLNQLTHKPLLLRRRASILSRSPIRPAFLISSFSTSRPNKLALSRKSERGWGFTFPFLRMADQFFTVNGIKRAAT